MDIEYGRTALLDRWRALKIDRSRVRRTMFAFVVVVIAIIVRVAIRNVRDDVATNADTVFPIHERQYKAFSFTNSVISDKNVLNAMVVDTFPIYRSFVNRELQLRNLATFTSHVRLWLNTTGTVCVHAKYFNVPYQIIVFQNMTAVNAEIPTMELDKSKRSYAHVRSIHGVEHWVTYPNVLPIKYEEHQQLSTVQTFLYGHQALCMYFYNHILDR